MMKKPHRLIMNISTLTLIVVTGIFLSFQVLAAPQVPIQAEREAHYGKFGGPFALVDHTGKTVHDTDFLGKYMLIFFGYTFCPDVCPTALQILSDGLDLMGDDAKKIQPIFITVDPERDTPEVMGDYTSNFGHGLIGLTGNQKAINAVVQEYGARFERDTADDGSAVTDGSYTVSHSAGTYMMDRKGKYLVTFPMGVSPEDLAKNVLNIMKKH